MNDPAAGRPLTATGRKVIAIYGEALLDDVLGIEIEAADRFEKERAALATPDEPVPVDVKWWVLADIAHERNESIVDIGGHCNHEDSPPECIREGQAMAAAYNARVAGRSWREASRRLHASGDDEPYATDEPVAGGLRTRGLLSGAEVDPGSELDRLAPVATPDEPVAGLDVEAWTNLTPQGQWDAYRALAARLREDVPGDEGCPDDEEGRLANIRQASTGGPDFT